MAQQKTTSQTETTTKVAQQETFRFAPQRDLARRPVRQVRGPIVEQQSKSSKTFSDLSDALGAINVGAAALSQVAVLRDQEAFEKGEQDFLEGLTEAETEDIVRENGFMARKGEADANRLIIEANTFINQNRNINSKEELDSVTQAWHNTSADFINAAPKNKFYLANFASRAQKVEEEMELKLQGVMLKGMREDAFNDINVNITGSVDNVLSEVITEDLKTPIGDIDIQNLNTLEGQKNLRDVRGQLNFTKINKRTRQHLDEVFKQGIEAGLTPREIGERNVAQIGALAIDYRMPELMNVFSLRSEDGQIPSEGGLRNKIDTLRRQARKRLDDLDNDLNRAEAEGKKADLKEFQGTFGSNLMEARVQLAEFELQGPEEGETRESFNRRFNGARDANMKLLRKQVLEAQQRGGVLFGDPNTGPILMNRIDDLGRPAAPDPAVRDHYLRLIKTGEFDEAQDMDQLVSAETFLQGQAMKERLVTKEAVSNNDSYRRSKTVLDLEFKQSLDEVNAAFPNPFSGLGGTIGEDFRLSKMSEEGFRLNQLQMDYIRAEADLIEANDGILTPDMVEGLRERFLFPLQKQLKEFRTREPSALDIRTPKASEIILNKAPGLLQSGALSNLSSKGFENLTPGEQEDIAFRLQDLSPEELAIISEGIGGLDTQEANNALKNVMDDIKAGRRTIAISLKELQKRVTVSEKGVVEFLDPISGKQILLAEADPRIQDSVLEGVSDALAFDVVSQINPEIINMLDNNELTPSQKDSLDRTILLTKDVIKEALGIPDIDISVRQTLDPATRAVLVQRLVNTQRKVATFLEPAEPQSVLSDIFERRMREKAEDERKAQAREEEEAIEIPSSAPELQSFSPTATLLRTFRPPSTVPAKRKR